MHDVLTRGSLTTAVRIIARAALASALLATLVTPIVAPSLGYPNTPTRTPEEPVPEPAANSSQAVQPGTLAQGPTPPGDDYHPMCQHYGENGFDRVESAPLFSRDRDRLNESDTWSKQEFEDACGYEPTWQLNRTLEFDFTSHQALPGVAEWNREDIRDIPFPQYKYPGMKRTAVHPEGADVVDVGAIRDASASLYAVSPSVGLRDQADAATTFLIRGETTIYGAQSYRVERPDRYVDDDTGPRQVDYTVKGEVVGSCLLMYDRSDAAGVRHNNRFDTPCYQNQTLDISSGLTPGADTSANARRYSELTFNYTAGMPSTLSYVTLFNYSVRKQTTYCADWNRSNESCDGEFVTTGDETTTYYTTAVDSFDVKYYWQPSPKVEVARFPNGETEFILQSQGRYGYRVGWEALFSEVRFQSGERAGWAWRVFSARRPQWSHLVTETNTTRVLSESPTHPLQNYAVPIAASTDDRGTHGLGTSRNITVKELLRASSATRTPSIDDRILISTPEPSYRMPYEVRYRSEESLDFESATVVGLLDGSNTTGLSVERRVDVRRSNITTSVTELDNESLRVTVTLRARNENRGRASYSPISTRRTNGYVTVNGERVETNASGQATVVVDESVRVAVEFHPESWTTNDRAVAYLEESTYVRTASFGGEFILTLVSELFVLFFPFILVLVTIRSIARNNPSTT